MHRSFIWLSIICVLCFLSCSKSGTGRGQDASASAVLNSDSGYIFLLEENIPAPESGQPQAECKTYMVIAGANPEKYAAYHSGRISRYADFIGLTADNEVCVIHPADGMTYTFSASPDSPETRFGFGMSQPGTDIYHLGIVPADAGDAAFHVRLAHFDAAANRVIGEIDLFSFDADAYLADRERINESLSSPVYVSENGATVIVRTAGIHLTANASGAASEMVPESLPLPRGVNYDYYRYNSTGDSVELWLDSTAVDFTYPNQAGISHNGTRNLFAACSPDGDEMLVLFDDALDEPTVMVDREPGGILRARLSPEGSRVGYFREPMNADGKIIEAVVVPVFSKSRHVYLRLAGVDDYCWTDDLKRVAYLSHAFGSSLVSGDEISQPLSGDRVYLHIVDIETLKDEVIYGSSTGQALYITDVLAEAEDFEVDDSSGGRVRKGTPSSDPQRRTRTHPGKAIPTDEGPSITG